MSRWACCIKSSAFALAAVCQVLQEWSPWLCFSCCLVRRWHCPPAPPWTGNTVPNSNLCVSPQWAQPALLSHPGPCGSFAACSSAPSQTAILCWTLQTTAATAAWEAAGHQWMSLTGLQDSAFTNLFPCLCFHGSAHQLPLSWLCL